MKNSVKLKKISIFLIAIFSVVAIFSMNGKIFAANENSNEENTEQTRVATVNSIFDIKGTNGDYKTSSEDSNIYLPYLRNAAGRIVVDKSIDNIGVLSSASTIDVNEPLKSLQFLISSDSVRINANLEYALVLSANDVVINSNIEKNALIFAGGTVTVDENATIGDDVIIVAKDVNIKGKISKSAVISANSLNVSGSIEEDLRCEINTLDISGNDNIKGNLFVNTYNKELNIKDKYPNVKEVKNVSKSFGNILLKAVISSLGFILLYVIVKKITKGKAYEKMLDKAKNNTLFVVLSGAISILAFPALFVLLILLSVLGLYMITIPVAVVYMAFLIVFVMLSVYVIGCTIFEYTNKKYIKAEKLSIELVGAFFTFLSLNLICKIPKIGAYIYMAMVMIAVGIMIAYFLKGDNKTKEIKK
mgnify:CR=1 FL=1